MTKLDIVIPCGDRHGELGINLTSLIHQTYKDWNLIIIDDCDTDIIKCEFLLKLINFIKLQGHKVIVEKTKVRHENCMNRMQGVRLGSAPYILRMDDDTFFAKNDDLERMMNLIIAEDLDGVGAVTPPVGIPEWKRENKFVKPIIDKVSFDDEGNVTMADDCGFSYIDDEVLPAHHLRSSFVYKRAIHDAGVSFDVPGRVAFREESKFCIASAFAGFNKFKVITGVKFHHLHTSSGGCRLSPNEYATSCHYGDEVFKTWCKRMWMKHKGSPY